jgi:hypothetical protein
MVFVFTNWLDMEVKPLGDLGNYPVFLLPWGAGREYERNRWGHRRRKY